MKDPKLDLLDSKCTDLKSPGIYIIDDQTFWKTQWEKHGTCSIELYKQNAYFDLAIKLYDLYNITKFFENNGIKRHMSHRLNTMSAAIKSETQFMPDIICISRSYGKKWLK
ncbi:hypothetical protein M9H77_28845 [Catharanthus roseus]|uniref:Uncharacterized protein n=1 Tax=Catharanthus roseus TaxID=4058 RepID=A0ACC0AHX8_CATRO|nr:hypothetical protein M9H77_28845 [Catharanthus roseus]